MNQNRYFTDKISEKRRELFFEYNKKRRISEIAYCYSLKEDLRVTYNSIVNSLLDFNSEDFSLYVDFGMAAQNPKDMPNRKIGQRLSRMRMKFKPITVKYKITNILISSDKTQISLECDEKDVSKETYEYIRKFSRLALVKIKKSDRLRLTLVHEEDLVYG